MVLEGGVSGRLGRSGVWSGIAGKLHTDAQRPWNDRRHETVDVRRTRVRRRLVLVLVR
jgi:hypothetical protein